LGFGYNFGPPGKTLCAAHLAPPRATPLRCGPISPASLPTERALACILCSNRRAGPVGQGLLPQQTPPSSGADTWVPGTSHSFTVAPSPVPVAWARNSDSSHLPHARAVAQVCRHVCRRIPGRIGRSRCACASDYKWLAGGRKGPRQLTNFPRPPLS
jgi:hypothetical protein